MGALFFHVDLDAFFASVEQRDNAEYRGKPVIVGALPGHRGVVSTCSYEARKFGLHSAMPISEAFKRCPHGIFLPVRMSRYMEVSRIVMRVLAEFTPDFMQVSVDEAMLDMTGTEKLWGSPESAAARLKSRVRDATGLTVSVGIGANKYIAKIASGIDKPDGLVYVRPGAEKEFMRSLKLEKLWGAGEKTRENLRSIRLATIAALQDVSFEVLESKFGTAGARFFSLAARGDDPGILSGESKSRSLSGESTFENDTVDRDAVLDIFRIIADDLAARLWDERTFAHTLGIKLRFGDFSMITRQCTRDSPYGSSDEIYDDATRLLDKNWERDTPLRLVGISLHDIGKGIVQRGLFDAEPPKAEEARKAVQEIREKGKGKLVRARFLDAPSRDK